MKKGKLITFEGPEGSGKSTQIKRAAAYLQNRGCKVLILREPGGTAVSEAIRLILLGKNLLKPLPETELLLYLAARAQIVQEKILPALKSGYIVLCDRYEDSTFAYQGYGRGIRLPVIETMSRFVRKSLLPDQTFLLDIDPGVGMGRTGRRDRMEREALSFHRKVRKGFLALAKKNKKRFVVINATKEKSEIAHLIRKRLAGELG